MPKKKYWSNKVTRTSNALDLDRGVFTWKDPQKIAASLKKSAETSTRKKTTSFHSPITILNLYINRAGKNLDPKQKEILQEVKAELRKLFGKTSSQSSI